MLDRFWAKVDASGDCWIWTGAVIRKHGQFGVGRGLRMYAHRYAYTTLVGAIPAGLTLDHLCRQPLCVNPDHLEPVSNRTNVLRGFGPSALNVRKTACKHGHLFTPENTTIRRTTGHRECRSCNRARVAAQRAVGKLAA